MDGSVALLCEVTGLILLKSEGANGKNSATLFLGRP